MAEPAVDDTLLRGTTARRLDCCNTAGAGMTEREGKGREKKRWEEGVRRWKSRRWKVEKDWQSGRTGAERDNRKGDVLIKKQ